MEKKIAKCTVQECHKGVRAIGLCSTHYSRYNRCGDVVGIYKITLNEKIYIGMSNVSIKDRITNEKSSLRTGGNTNVSQKLLDYFNYLCGLEGTLSRDSILDKYFSIEILESSIGWHKVDENFKIKPFKDKSEQKSAIYKIRSSNNKEIEGRRKLEEVYWRAKERIWIRKYKELDKINGTDYCLNINE